LVPVPADGTLVAGCGAALATTSFPPTVVSSATVAPVDVGHVGSVAPVSGLAPSTSITVK
jgi:hypothetical protein